MKKTPPTLLCDFYKISHRDQYPEGTEVVYSTWTPRSNKYFPKADHVIAFGFQAFIQKYLIDYFNENFFDREWPEVRDEYCRVIRHCLGVENPSYDHLYSLYFFGCLPLEIKALPEGTHCPIGVPMLTIRNTHPEFFWLTNFLETLLSGQLWIPSTSATIANCYRELLEKYAKETAGSADFVPFQGHDFSMRGMALEAATMSGSGHLLSFVGTDTIPAILHLEHYYKANIENELVGCSVPATEHSVMCAGGDGDGEEETFRRIIEEIYPSGIVSIVSDTWDLWHVLTDTLPKLKDKIMARDGKVVIRPDSGDPVDILCGAPKGVNSVVKGVVELLWDTFGGTINDKGYKELDPHIGAIYGDAITLARCEEICERLKAKGFASTNVVYGIGSYTYQYNTRDTFGFAMKSTACVINGKEKMIYKNPVTDDGTKKSNIGAVRVVDDDGLKCIDNNSIFNTHEDLMNTIFINGLVMNIQTLEEIRQRVKEK